MKKKRICKSAEHCYTKRLLQSLLIHIWTVNLLSEQSSADSFQKREILHISTKMPCRQWDSLPLAGRQIFHSDCKQQEALSCGSSEKEQHNHCASLPMNTAAGDCA